MPFKVALLMSTPERADRLIRSLCRVTGGLFGVVVIVAIAYARDLNFIFDVAALPDGLKLAAMMSSAVPLIAAPLQ